MFLRTFIIVAFVLIFTKFGRYAYVFLLRVFSRKTKSQKNPIQCSICQKIKNCDIIHNIMCCDQENPDKLLTLEELQQLKNAWYYLSRNGVVKREIAKWIYLRIFIGDYTYSTLSRKSLREKIERKFFEIYHQKLEQEYLEEICGYLICEDHGLRSQFYGTQ